MGTKSASIHRLRQMVQEACRQNPHLTTRLERAAFLVLLRQIAKVGEDRYQVASEDGLRYYSVVNGHCECSDYLRHGRGHPCKHRLALSMVVQLGICISESSPGESPHPGCNSTFPDQALELPGTSPDPAA